MRLLRLVFSCLFSFLLFVVVVLYLLFDAEKLGGGFENHAVNGLLRQMHLVEPDPAFVAGLGLLHGDVKPVLLFDGIAAALVVAGLVGLVVLFAVGVVKPLAKQSPARRTADDGDGIVVGKFAAEGRAARAQAHISGSPGHGGAAREQAHGTGKRNELNQ
jgi:hypothetical protein